MPSVYPAMKATLGQWTYFVAKMSFEKLAKEVEYADKVHEDTTLDLFIQRPRDQSRIDQLIRYLADREDRFFNSIVVAALGGNPEFIELELVDNPGNRMMKKWKVDQSFGALSFEGGEKYYALDGQHRLTAIRQIKDNDPGTAAEDISNEYRKTLMKDEISVVIVMPSLFLGGSVESEDGSIDSESEFFQDFLRSYRSLFSSLNRYAKPTDEATNIIMDEVDGIAILTRRLINEHKFFEWNTDNPDDYDRVKWKSGKNLRENDPYFTQIEVLYEMNLWLLATNTRINAGWELRKDDNDNYNRVETTGKVFTKQALQKTWCRQRPDPEILDLMYNELTNMWDAILSNLKELMTDDFTTLRKHNPDDDDGVMDHAFLWPIMQTPVARVARELVDEESIRQGQPVSTSLMEKALEPLGKVDWDLHNAPWRHLLLIEQTQKDGGTKWIMRNESRTPAAKSAETILRWIVGLDVRDDDSIKELKSEWLRSPGLMPPQEEKDEDAMWSSVNDMADNVR